MAALSSRMSINGFIRDHGSLAEKDHSPITYYRDESIDALIAQILVPILTSLRELPVDAVPDRKDHLKHIKEYPKKLIAVRKEDHDDRAMRALGTKGIIGEVDAEALGRRKIKVEWGCCLDIIKRLGERLGAMMQHNPALGDVFCIEVCAEDPAYPFALHLVKVLAKVNSTDKKIA